MTRIYHNNSSKASSDESPRPRRRRRRDVEEERPPADPAVVAQLAAEVLPPLIEEYSQLSGFRFQQTTDLSRRRVSLIFSNNEYVDLRLQATRLLAGELEFRRYVTESWDYQHFFGWLRQYHPDTYRQLDAVDIAACVIKADKQPWFDRWVRDRDTIKPLVQEIEQLLLAAYEPAVREFLDEDADSFSQSSPDSSFRVVNLKVAKTIRGTMGERYWELLSTIHQHANPGPFNLDNYEPFAFPAARSLYHHLWSEAQPAGLERWEQQEEERKEEEDQEREKRRQQEDENTIWDAGLTAGLEGDELDEFLDRKPISWLVENVLVEGQPLVIGGPQKSMKTSLAIDLSVSLATGQPFLGQFNVTSPKRVLLFSGESGGPIIAETADRVGRAKGLEGRPKSGIVYNFSLPKLDTPNAEEVLVAAIRRYKPAVMILDPLYLCLLSGGEGGNAANLYDVGPLLKKVADVCSDRHVTPILVHHAKKGVRPGHIVRLDDLTFSGIGEFARQWLLVNHSKTYRIGSGYHELTLSVGGSAGHSSLWDVTIKEGQQNADFTGRCWGVTVNPHEARDREAADKPRSRKSQAHADKIVAALQELGADLEPVSRTAVAKKTGLSGTSLKAAVGLLEEEGRIEKTVTTKIRGGLPFESHYLRLIHETDDPE